MLKDDELGKYLDCTIAYNEHENLEAGTVYEFSINN
jgi:hypothetical protein